MKYRKEFEYEAEACIHIPSHLAQVIEEWDGEGRPQQKVALLHGPPGLGKTTLAHIVARHAGYKARIQHFPLLFCEIPINSGCGDQCLR